MKQIRTVSKWSAFIALAFMVAQRIFNIEIPVFWLGLEPVILAVLVSLGILTDTGVDPQPLSGKSILEKLKSPMAIGAVLSLCAYIMYEFIPALKVEAVMEIIDYAFFAFVGFNVWQSPNVRNGFIKDD